MNTDKHFKLSDFSKVMLVSNSFAVITLGAICLQWNYRFESVFLGAIFQLFIIPSILVTLFNIGFSLYLIILKKEFKMSSFILIMSLIGVLLLIYMQLNYP